MIRIEDDILHLKQLGLLDGLLYDRTTKHNIIWATDVHASLGSAFARDKEIPLGERIGILDRKLRVVNENTDSEEEWLKWVFRAVEATYGYEFQGDNLLIARINILMTFEEYLKSRWNRMPTEAEYARLLKTVTWNIWQMDGLNGDNSLCKSAGRKPPVQHL